MTDVSRRLRRETTEAEKRLWRALRAEPFKAAHFRRQVPLGSFIVDFASHAARVVIELDGGQHAETMHAARDEARDTALAERGYQVIRFWNSDLADSFEGVLDTIFRALYDRAEFGDGAAVTPAPNPSPQGGGG